LYADMNQQTLIYKILARQPNIFNRNLNKSPLFFAFLRFILFV
jgi:hypothetical protein